MVFFEVIINSQSSASRGQDEWADMAATESLVGYKLEDVRVRGKNKRSASCAANYSYLMSKCFVSLFHLLLTDVLVFPLQARMDSVHQHLERSRQVQTVLRAFEARDRYLLEDNLWRVSFWSCLNLLVMLTVAVTQIYTLRRLFDDTRRICT